MKRVCTTAIALAAALAPVLTAAPAYADPLSQTGQNQLVERVIQRAVAARRALRLWRR